MLRLFHNLDSNKDEKPYLSTLHVCYQNEPTNHIDVKYPFVTSFVLYML